MSGRARLALGLLAALLSTARAEEKTCPKINLTTDGPAGPVCVGAPLTIAASDNEIAGDYMGMTLFPGKQWTWKIFGITADPQEGDVSTAAFTPLSKGDAVIDFSLVCTSSPGCEDCDGTFTAQTNFYVSELKLGVDCNRDGAYDDEDRTLEKNVGWFVGVNHDDDNTNGTPDMADTNTVVDENDLVPIHLNPDPTWKSGELTLEAVSGGDKIRVWKFPTRGEQVKLPMTWRPGHGTIPPIRYVEGIESSDDPKDVQLRLRYTYDSGEHSSTSFLTVIKVDLVPDWNHDRVIDESDRDQATVLNPYRFWINDDKDDGDVASGDSDLPGQNKGNASDDKVNGRCDLLDFFPVWLDIGNAVKLLPSTWNCVYILRQADGAVNFFQSDLIRQEAGNYLIEETEAHGWEPAFPADRASVTNIPHLGMNITDSGPDFDGRINQDTNKGVLIMEGKVSTTCPLVLEIRKGDLASTPIYETKLPLSLSGVEDMTRWINLRHLTGGAETKPTDTITEPPNFPDAVSNGKQIVFIAGFNNTEDDHRASSAEVFKRLYWSGSQAMFTGVSWEGNEDPAGWAMPVEFSYHLDVQNAFAVSLDLA